MTSVRMDKWLWAARFFKTRALAAKAAREVRIGDMLRVTNDGGDETRERACQPPSSDAIIAWEAAAPMAPYSACHGMPS